jgi:hypothetical protein
MRNQALHRCVQLAADGGCGDLRNAAIGFGRALGMRSFSDTATATLTGVNGRVELLYLCAE